MDVVVAEDVGRTTTRVICLHTINNARSMFSLS
jgi:hypothetical protein